MFSCSLLQMLTSQIHPHMFEPKSDLKFESGLRKHMKEVYNIAYRADGYLWAGV